MKIEITNVQNGESLGVYEGNTVEEALAEMYRAAGYDAWKEEGRVWRTDAPGGFWATGLKVTKVER